MTKTQLINILAKRAEVQEKDSSLFFEDFIKIFSEKISEGEIHFLRGVGHFFRYSGIHFDETNSEKNIPPTGKKIKLILFHETLEFIDDIYKALVIIPPGEVEFDAAKDEEYFSLSFGKPVISFPKKPDDFLVTDHIRNLGIRASKLLKEMEYLDKRKTDEEIKVLKRKSLKFGADSTEKTVEDKKASDEQSENKIKSSEPTEKLSGSDSSAFDLYYHSRFSQMNRQDRGLPWDYSREAFGKKSESSESRDKTEKKIEQSEESKKFSVENKSTSGKPDSSEVKLTNKDSFQRVEKVIKPIEKESSFIDKSGELTEKKTIVFNKVPASPGEFSEVKTKNTTLNKVSNKNYGTVESLFKESAQKDMLINKDPFVIRRRKIISLVTFLFIIASIFGVAYFVIQSGILFSSNESESVVNVKRPPSVEVIERNDLIPVSYPYDKQSEQSIVNGVSTDAFKVDNKIEGNKKEENKKVAETKSPNQKNEIKKEETPDVSIKKPEVIPDNNPEVVNVKITPPPLVVEPTETKTESSGNTANTILRYKDYFVVQVGIYSSYSLADSEAENFRNMGYNAIVETAQIGGETKYRLRVGDFTSFQQADRFSRKYNQ